MKLGRELAAKCLELAGEGPPAPPARRRRSPPPAETEAGFQRAVVALAELHGWAVFSVPDSRRATASGFPDLVCGKGGRGVLAAELKRRGQRPRADQLAWLAFFAESGAGSYWWTPANWPEIKEVLGK